ncbi:MAG: alpha/beta hydrolase [Chloroflexi bacterium]|nr:alpha/beta hydrolase [Chloroflexota bacterium]MBU1748131.1 alpha/beta hydrolase [Chloroflexota bacterium]MBU1880337.1 alpha/beta hydrolase [Chloroflexota bacterium]
MPSIQVNDERLFYVHRGPAALAPAEMPAVLFSHGAGGTHRHWLPEVVAAGALTRAYALDLPGHGRSTGTGRDTISGYVEVVRGLLDALGLDRAVVGGHSMGGAIAQTLALTYPDRCAGLILTGTGARLRVLPAIMEGVLTDFSATVDVIGQYAYGPDAPTDLLRLGREEMLQNDPQVYHDDFLACDRFDIMDRLGEIRVPTLILCGTADRLTPPKYSHYLHEHIAGSTLTLIEGAGHMVMLEQPAQMNEAIARFLTGL